MSQFRHGWNWARFGRVGAYRRHALLTMVSKTLSEASQKLGHGSADIVRSSVEKVRSRRQCGRRRGVRSLLSASNTRAARLVGLDRNVRAPIIWGTTS